MSTPFVGEIRMFGGNFAPNGWMFCEGQLLPISQYQVLFQLIGTTYGGDGQNTFGLPDLRGRVPIHQGQGLGLSNYPLGQIGGAESVTLTAQQMPIHTHPPACRAAGSESPNPTNMFWGATDAAQYASSTSGAFMNSAAVGVAGGSQPHDNMLPFLCVSFIISLFGVFPSQN